MTFETLPRKSTAIIVDENSIIDNFRYKPNLMRLNTQSVETGQRPPNGSGVGVEHNLVANLERISKVAHT
jgi:hypothetical protein